jgi:nicotinate-nucleotide adenylyltransferase
MVKGKHIGLFFGSFNPVHVGHLIIAQCMATYTEIDQVWFVVSPQNPLKNPGNLARDIDRLRMVRLAIEDNPRLKASNIEFSLPKPSFTIDTMAYLHEKYPQHTFSLIMGSDNLKSIEKWKHFELLLKRYPIHIYGRKGAAVQASQWPHAKIYTHDFPLLHISATWIRQQVKEGKSVRYMVPESVLEYLESARLYKI